MFAVQYACRVPSRITVHSQSVNSYFKIKLGREKYGNHHNVCIVVRSSYVRLADENVHLGSSHVRTT